MCTQVSPEMKENNVRPFIDEAIFGDQSSLFCFFHFDCYIEVKPNVNSVVSFSLKSFFSIVFFFLFLGNRSKELVETGGNQLALVSWHVPFDPRATRSAWRWKPLSDDINQESETDRCVAVPKKKCKGGWDLGGK